MRTRKKFIMPLVAMACAVIAIAAIAAFLGSDIQKKGVHPGAVASILVEVSQKTGFSSKSSLGLAADLYYAIIPLITPIFALIFYILVRHGKSGVDSELHKKPLSANGRLTGIFSGSLLTLFAVLVLLSIKGDNGRYFSVSDSTLSLVVQGWIIFAITGMILGIGLLFVRMSIFRPFSK